MSLTLSSCSPSCPGASAFNPSASDGSDVCAAIGIDNADLCTFDQGTVTLNNVTIDSAAAGECGGGAVAGNVTVGGHPVEVAREGCSVGCAVVSEDLVRCTAVEGNRALTNGQC